MFVAYIDESYDGSAVPEVFCLSSIVSDNSMWIHFEWDWLKVLEEKNKELRSQGRTELSRFHATYLNNFADEYKDWSAPERQAFCEQLNRVFERNPVHIHSWDMPLQILVEEIPGTKSNPIGFAYCVLLGEVMRQIGEVTLSLPSYKGDLIALRHERCDYDASLLEWFDLLLEDEQFAFRKRFVSIAPERWESCVPLQAADLLAYENFKEGMRHHIKGSKEAKRGRMRLGLEALINLESIGARACGYTREMIQDLKRRLDKDTDTKQALFQAARIT
jgi:hypothetical protein